MNRRGKSGFYVFRGPSDEFVIRPLVLVHPAEENEEEIDEEVLGDGELFSVIIQLPHNFVRDIDDVHGTLGLPVSRIFVLSVNEESEVVQKAYQNTSIFWTATHDL